MPHFHFYEDWALLQGGQLFKVGGDGNTLYEINWCGDYTSKDSDKEVLVRHSQSLVVCFGYLLTHVWFRNIKGRPTSMRRTAPSSLRPAKTRLSSTLKSTWTLLVWSLPDTKQVVASVSLLFRMLSIQGWTKSVCYGPLLPVTRPHAFAICSNVQRNIK
jgi:hypothetical protein